MKALALPTKALPPSTFAVIFGCMTASAMAAPSVSTQYPVYLTGEPIMASFAGGPGNSKDWIGIYPDGVVSDGSIASTRWKYVDDTQAGNVAFLDGQVNLPGLSSAGDWKIYFKKNDGYENMAESSLTVLDAGSPLVRTGRNHIPGAAFDVAFFSSSNARDWIGIYKQGQVPAPGVNSTIWNYTNGTQTGTVTIVEGSVRFASGLPEGNWVAHLLENDGYTSLASQAFTVAQVVAPGSRLLSLNPADKASGTTPLLDFSARLSNGTSNITPASVTLEIDGVKVAHTFEQQATFALVTYKGTTVQDPVSTHSIKLTYKDGTNNSYVNEASYTVANFYNVKLPAPLYFENFDSTAEGQLPAGWTEQNFTEKTSEDFDLGRLGSASYATWTTVNASRFAEKIATYENTLEGTSEGEGNDYKRVLTPNPLNVLNGQPLNEPLAQGRFLFSDSGYRGGRSQIMFAFTPDYDLSGKSNINVAFKSLWEQNQDSFAALEYSIDKGANWLPVAYFLDTPDIIKIEGSQAIDAEATLNTAAADIATYDDLVSGEMRGGFYGAFIAAPITPALAPFIQGRLNDNATESKRYELYRLPQADNQKTVRFRFAHAGTDSWYWGIDDFGLYSISSGVAVEPSLGIRQANGNVILEWPAGLSGYLLESSPSLTASSWNPVSGVTGNSHTLVPGTKAFFRLRRQ